MLANEILTTTPWATGRATTAHSQKSSNAHILNGLPFGKSYERSGKKNVKRMACKARLASARIQWHERIRKSILCHISFGKQMLTHYNRVAETVWPSQHNICIQKYFMLWQTSVSHLTSKWNSITLKKLFRLFCLCRFFTAMTNSNFLFELVKKKGSKHHILWTFTSSRLKLYDNSDHFRFDDNLIEYDKCKRIAFQPLLFRKCLQFAFMVYKVQTGLNQEFMIYFFPWERDKT